MNINKMCERKSFADTILYIFILCSIKVMQMLIQLHYIKPKQIFPEFQENFVNFLKTLETRIVLPVRAVYLL